MPKIFVSYSRSDRPFIDQFIPLIRRVYGNDSVWFDDGIHGGVDWWQMIMDEIDKCDLFVYLVSNESLESPYCQAELREALRLNKAILPVIVRRLKPPYPGELDADLASVLRKTQYVDMAGGFRDPNTIAALYAAITRLLDAVPQQPVAPQTSTPTPEPPVPDKKQGLSEASRIAIIVAVIGLVGTLLAAAIGILPDLLNRDEPEPSTEVALVTTETVTPTEGLSADDARATGAAQAYGTLTALAPTDTPTITLTPSDTPISSSDIQQTAQAEIFQTETSAAGTQAVISQQTQNAVLTEQFIAGATVTYIAQLSLTPPSPTATQTPEPPTPTEYPTTTPNNTQSPTDTSERDTQINVTIETRTFVEIPDGLNVNLRAGPGSNFAVVDTASPGQSFEILETDTEWFRIGDETWIFSGVVETVERDIYMSTISGFGSSLDNTIENNADWTPVERDFDGVTMVLVPAGCFMMGSDNGDIGEQPVHEICFDEPFWIDKYEVTNAQYGSVGCSDWSSDPNQPRNCVDWFEAQAHCEARSARLPTEAEWEYAARGSDSWVYPWGNEYDAALVIGEDDPTYGDISTAPVGSRPEGASWVGAMDMSGNVWEWTSSLYEAYPYEETDGRERDTGGSTDVLRVLRGGSFYSSALNLRSADRIGGVPDGSDYVSGFRCARSNQ